MHLLIFFTSKATITILLLDGEKASRSYFCILEISGYLCSCGSRLDRSSTTRSTKSACVRIFMSIRFMKPIPSDVKVCNICRHSYNRWKGENMELSALLTDLVTAIIDEPNKDNDSVLYSTMCKIFLLISLYLLSSRVAQWRFLKMVSSLNRLFQAVVQLRLPIRIPLHCSSTAPFHRTGINE
jgi:hypothetical protein